MGYDFLSGGKNHSEVDRKAAAHALRITPDGPAARQANRAFLRRVIRFLVSEAGIDQFLDLGSRLPTQGNVHEVATDATVLYTDVDPVTIRLGQSILAGSDRAGYGFGDATDIGTIDPAQLHRFVPGWGRRPVGVVFLGLAAFLDDATLTHTLDELYAAAAPGSLLAVDFDTEELAGHPQALAMMGPQFRMRPPAAFAPLLGRWAPTADGIVPVAEWRPEGPPERVPDAFHGVLATRPAD
ncbi:SAM-dependent methyltransferase [Micromonospora foliorum]|uniref:SAM-dependent methyltransferase n=1 Tax=Micromonospora foliorum TaxID=2911210 RepID=UPI001EE7A4F6|nr:SAM-dependent methyltransferase [Micromonospora foliorum]MCG5435298.1 SAM-dependent methyltransferase [Micromonospora foliorum]